MKLVELLARELDVWPDHAECATQEGGGCAYFWKSYRLSYVRGDWVHGSGYGLISEDWSHSLSELAVDHTTAIITRADWQAERERIAGGWIAWGGGECPVAEGVRVDAKFRNNEIAMNCEAGTHKSDHGTMCAQIWTHDDHPGDIIAYRLHKPEQASVEAIEAGIAAADAGKVKPIAEVKSMYEYNPIHTRDRILEIDRTTEALEEERVALVQRLADEGFVLARVDGKVAPVEDMSDWRNWEAGDIIEMIGDGWADLSQDGEYVIQSKRDAAISIIDDAGDRRTLTPDDDTMYEDGRIPDFKWRSRPTA